MPRAKKKGKLSAAEALREWMSWVNSWNAEQLAVSFEDWMREQGYELGPIQSKEKRR